MTKILEQIDRGEIEVADATLKEQAEAVLLEYLGLRDQLEILWEKVRARKYPPEDYESRRARLPLLLAAYVTLRGLADQSATVSSKRG